MSDPVFPPEIEYIIFTNALGLHGGEEAVRKFLPVAKRVYEWLMKELMRTIVYRGVAPILRYPFSWKSSTLERYGSHTRNLFLWKSQDDEGDIIQIDQCLSFCPNITNLALWTPLNSEQLEHVELLSRLPLTHLSVNLHHLPPSPILIPFFSRITHLENLSGVLHIGDSNLATLKHFTSLMHLAIPNPNDELVLKLIFEAVPTLEVLALWAASQTMMVMEMKVGGDDLRVVGMTFAHGDQVEEWLLDVQEGRGMWGLSSAEVRKRKRARVGNAS